MRLENKVAIVTGGAEGIGAAICQLFAQNGARVIAVDIADSLKYEDEYIEYYKLNVTNVDGCRALCQYAMDKYGKIDILVNNAGITRDAMTYKMTDEMWDTVIDVDLKGVFNLTRFVGPKMEELGEGSIVNISSVVGIFGNIGQANYSAAKAGIIGMTKTWAKEFARKGAAVRVNAIAPGYTLTNILKTVPQDLLDNFARKTMLGRLGKPEEIANAVLFLSSDDASYITGHTLDVNGGMRL